jgi:hypothetical protein
VDRTDVLSKWSPIGAISVLYHLEKTAEAVTAKTAMLLQF